MENCKPIYYIILIFSLLWFCAGESSARENFFYSHPSGKETTAHVYENHQYVIPGVDKKKPKSKNSSNSKNKKVTFETFEENYLKARQYYEKHLYISAAKLFEELYPLSLGTPLADTVLFFFADCYYLNGDYELAAYHFKEYAGKYASNPRAEDAHFKAIQSLSHLSPDYSLDQTETYYVIEEIEAFIGLYPNSSHMEECNALLDKMQNKLAHKAFEILKLYYNTENYKAAQIAARNFMKKYSFSQYADDAYAIWVKNNYEYASKSVESKKIERYTECIEVFQSMQIYHPDSHLTKEVAKYATEAQNRINKKETKETKKSKKKTNKNEN